MQEKWTLPGEGRERRLESEVPAAASAGSGWAREWGPCQVQCPVPPRKRKLLSPRVTADLPAHVLPFSGSSIEDVVQSLKRQDLALEVDDARNRNGSDDPSYNGAIIVSGGHKVRLLPCTFLKRLSNQILFLNRFYFKWEGKKIYFCLPLSTFA